MTSHPTHTLFSLQNPKYKESFAITWKFAMSNNSVRSVRNNRARAQNNQDEGDADKMEVHVIILCVV